MAFSSVTMLHQYASAGGVVPTGSVIFTLTQSMTNDGVTIQAGEQVTAELDVDGNLTQTLPSNLDPDTQPLGSLWRVDERVDGSFQAYWIAVPSAGLPGASADLGGFRPGFTPRDWA